MKFIEHSNSVYKSNSKYVSPRKRKIRKYLIEFLIFIFIFFLLFSIFNEATKNNNAVASLISSHRLGSYNNRKITYGVSGSGSTIILFESDIGKTLLEWNPIIRNTISGARMIYYDRLGYGGSDSFKGNVTVSEQVEALNNLVLNTGYDGKIILVSEGYGSAIHIEFLKKYSEKVGAMIVINPVIFKNGLDFNVSIYEKLKLKFMEFISSLGITRFLNKFSIFANPYVDIYNNNSVSRNKENYLIRMMSADYYSIVHKEKESMKKYLRGMEYLNDIGTYDIPVIVIDSEFNKSDDYESLFKSYFSNVEFLYFENTSNFTYSDSEYLLNLISNMSSRISEK